MCRLTACFYFALFLISCSSNPVTSKSGNEDLAKALSSKNDSIRSGAYYHLVDSLKNKSWDETDILPFQSSILNDSKSLLREALVIQKTETDKTWIWNNDHYLFIRESLSVLLDILGYLKNDSSEKILESALLLQDSRPKLFACISLVKNGKNVSQQIIDSVAADDECRIWLLRGLKQVNGEKFFPLKYKTQVLIAQSEMVDWLKYPTELNRVPDEIKLEKVQQVSGKEGLEDFYLFKFRSNDSAWANHGWMAGVAGGYEVQNEPTDENTGYTFSSFEKWDSKVTDEHLKSVIGQIDKANAKQINGTYKTSK